jgi:hypothetical protein
MMNHRNHPPKRSLLAAKVLLPFTVLVVVVLLFWMLRKSPSQFQNKQSPDDHYYESSSSSCPSSPVSFFDSPVVAPICAKVPNASATYLWNRYMYAAAAHHHADDDSSKKQFSNLWNAQDFLRRGILTRPKHKEWGAILEKVHRKLLDGDSEDEQPAAVQMVILTGDSSLLDNDDCQISTSQSKSCPTTMMWPSLLEEWIHAILMPNVTNKHKHILQVHVIAVNSTTSDFATTLQKYHLLPPTIDILVDAYAVQDMKMLLRNYKDVSRTPDVSNALRQLKQTWIRSVLLECCTQQERRPLLVILDDYIGTGSGILTDSIYTRVVRRLTDWYQIPFVSFGSMIRPRLYHQQQQEQQYDNQLLAAHTNNNNNKALSIASLLAFAALQFTIDYCSTTSHMEVPASPLLKPGVQHLVESSVIPPALDLDLTLQEVSSKWNAAAMQANCNNSQTTTTCPVAFLVSNDYQKTIQNTPVAAQHGWIIASSDNKNNGLLLSSSSQSSNTKNDVWTTTFRIDRPDVFQIVVENNASKADLAAKLQIQLEPTSSSSQGKPLSAVVETAARHDGAVSHRIDLSSSSWKGPVEVTLTLRLLQGDSIRIVSLFVCNAPIQTDDSIKE